MIELGLSRITRLLANSSLPWRAIHVAGTNGKGSVCAYVSALLHANKVPCGRFTSPHLIDRWDCITINEQTVKENVFREVEEAVKKRNASEDIQASEFELLTATAFEIFTLEKVKIAAIEVGMGGRLDATNILRDPLVTVITKISLDHQAFLGKTLEEIAFQKAGIMKPGVPTVLDSFNRAKVIGIVRNNKETVNAGPTFLVGQPDCSRFLHKSPWGRSIMKEQQHQAMNMGLAVMAVELALRASALPYDQALIEPTLAKVHWPGRLQLLSIKSITGRKEKILLDGAHNASSVAVLYRYIQRTIRKDERTTTWVIAISRGKDIVSDLSRCFHNSDNIICTEFGPVDGMPWVTATPASELKAAVKTTPHLIRRKLQFSAYLDRNLTSALQKATELAKGGPLIVCGSLYLVSDVLRLLRTTAMPKVRHSFLDSGKDRYKARIRRSRL